MTTKIIITKHDNNGTINNNNNDNKNNNNKNNNNDNNDNNSNDNNNNNKFIHFQIKCTFNEQQYIIKCSYT